MTNARRQRPSLLIAFASLGLASCSWRAREIVVFTPFDEKLVAIPAPPKSYSIVDFEGVWLEDKPDKPGTLRFTRGRYEWKGPGGPLESGRVVFVRSGPDPAVGVLALFARGVPGGRFEDLDIRITLAPDALSFQFLDGGAVYRRTPNPDTVAVPAK